MYVGNLPLRRMIDYLLIIHISVSNFHVSLSILLFSAGYFFIHCNFNCLFIICLYFFFFFFFSSRRRHTRFDCDWSSDVCSSDLSISSSADEEIERGDRLQPVPPRRGERCEIVQRHDRGHAQRERQRPVRSQIGRASCRERV